MKKGSKKVLKETWENQYSEKNDTAIKDKPFFELEVKTIKREVENFSKGKDNLSILELGCGTGFLASELIKDSLKDIKYTYTGVDLSKNAIEISKSRKLSKAFFLEIDFFKFFEKSAKKFDLIISQRSIMALLKKDEQIKLLKLINSRLTKNGVGLFTECLYESSQKINEYRKQLGIKPFEKVWHSRYLRIEEIKKIFPKFEIIDFCSTYWLITRIIYPYFEEPKHNTKLAQVASKFPEFGNYGLVKLIIIKK